MAESVIFQHNWKSGSGQQINSRWVKYVSARNKPSARTAAQKNDFHMFCADG